MLTGLAGDSRLVLDGEQGPACLVRGATTAEIQALCEKIRLLGGEPALVLKQLAD